MYKFIENPHDIQFLLRGCIKFTPIPELNDPSELLPNVVPEDVRVSLERLRLNGYDSHDLDHLRQQGALLRRLAPDFQAIAVPQTKEEAKRIVRSPFYDDLPLLQRLLERTAAEISSKVGVFCLSLRSDSLPMWAHYARNATGLVVEFQNLEQVFEGDDTGILRRVVPVRYERERPGVTFDPRSHESLFFAKFQDWAYEQEVRVILPLDDCRQMDAAGRRLFLFDIPQQHVRRVILGWRMQASVVEQVVDFVRRLNPTVGVAQGKFERGQVHTVDLASL